MTIIGRGRMSVLAMVCLGCGDSGGGDGPGPGASACRLDGAAIELPLATRFDVAATSSGYLIVLPDEQGVASYLLDDGGLGARVDVPLADVGQPLVVAAQGDTAVATQIYSAGFDGLPIARFSGGAWTSERDVDAGQGSQLPGPTAIALDAGGHAAIAWIDGLSEERLLVAWWSADGWGEYGAIEHGLAELSRAELHATFDATGALHLTFLATDAAGEFGLFSVSHPAGGDWSAARRLGDADGSLGNIIISALVATPAGTWAPIIAPADFASGSDGGLAGYALDPGGSPLSGPRDDRPVVSGLAAAVLSDGRIVASASWGENNFDAAASDDEVVLYVCAGATCREGAVIEADRGTFYGATRIATRGKGGVVVYHAEPKLDGGPERTVAQRFSCD